ncbi:hypothetical protein MJ904_21745 [Massilia sp. MB5]|uniref:hypothetical protein n=1 Tax=unclassified Massilia TaxID=2609279 RepID=UPI000ABEE6C1|nr:MULTISPECIES: hypothetical protein [unclassified Massilia]UMR29645.1 hypothetical protein MJ904_21745 [Massilia sp. MB5]
MSYLQPPRLAFSGYFQADVSTVNNDPRHFDNISFEPYFQDLQENQQANGWWNPVGTGIFRFRDAAVRSVVDPSGNLQIGQGDPVLNMFVGNAFDRASAKIVDVDPDWQLASNLYGLGITLVAPNGQVVLRSEYEANPFRDLWFGRSAAPGDSGASAMFQSVLTQLEWNLDGINSPFLQELYSFSQSGTLSIRLTTYGFGTKYGENEFCYGKLIGAIGPVIAQEPRSFILGRRFMPTTRNRTGDLASTQNIGCFSAFVDQNRTLQLDLSNALPLADKYLIEQLGPMQIVLLKDPLTAQDDLIGPEAYYVLASLDQTDYQQWNLSGIQSVPLHQSIYDVMNELPFALLSGPNQDGKSVVAIRESLLGLEVRSEDIVFRLDPNDSNANHADTTIYAARYGQPMAGQQLNFWVAAPATDTDNTPVSQPPGTTPRALLPVNNVPAFAVQFQPALPVTDAAGRVAVRLQGPEVMDHPREYIDGQLYTISYNFSGSDPALQQNFDKLAVLVFSTVPVVDNPTWNDVQPILQQYANLYPVMSQGLFDFSQKDQADANAFIMRFVLDKGINDPDQMPVTRDMSSAKRAMLIRYFDQVLESQGRPSSLLHMFGKRCPTRGGAALRPQDGRAAPVGTLPGKSRGPNP